MVHIHFHLTTTNNCTEIRAAWHEYCCHSYSAHIPTCIKTQAQQQLDTHSTYHRSLNDCNVSHRICQTTELIQYNLSYETEIINRQLFARTKIAQAKCVSLPFNDDDLLSYFFGCYFAKLISITMLNIFNPIFMSFSTTNFGRIHFTFS